MIEAFTLKSRGKDMVCLLEYKDPSVRGKKVVLYKHGFFGNKITPHRIMVNASHELQEEGYTICRFDCAGAGDSEGDSHYTTIYGEIEDTKVVLHWIKENIRPEKFMILGYSMGGIVTSVLCNEVPLDGILLWSPKAAGAHNRCAFGRKSFVRGLASPIVRTANQTRTLCVLKQWFSVLTLCAPTHGFSNKCLFCHVYRRLSTLLAIKNVGANQ